MQSYQLTGPMLLKHDLDLDTRWMMTKVQGVLRVLEEVKGRRRGEVKLRRQWVVRSKTHYAILRR